MEWREEGGRQSDGLRTLIWIGAQFSEGGGKENGEEEDEEEECQGSAVASHRKKEGLWVGC